MPAGLKTRTFLPQPLCNFQGLILNNLLLQITIYVSLLSREVGLMRQ
ncbi:hypothetical protein SynA1560_02969 [Synechococcus sp. A15-60]|nr:hypothetical protein SynA1560_02969 [Synechococcus sp. A15-60]